MESNVERPKRKYQKQIDKATLSIRYYLNTKLKGKLIENEQCFPIYVQISYKGKTNHVKSRMLSGSYITNERFDSYILENSSLVEREKKFIIGLLKDHGRYIDPVKILNSYLLKEPLNEVVDFEIIREIKYTIAKQDTEAINQLAKPPVVLDFNKDDFNYLKILSSESEFVNLINWANTTSLKLLYHLPKLLKNFGLDIIQDKYFKSVSFEEIYKVVCEKAFHNEDCNLVHWSTGEFEKAAFEIYSNTPQEADVSEILNNVNSLLEANQRVFHPAE